jgi:ABC-type protease/lipase transport system fused ATPase/permease subunit
MVLLAIDPAWFDVISKIGGAVITGVATIALFFLNRRTKENEETRKDHKETLAETRGLARDVVEAITASTEVQRELVKQVEESRRQMQENARLMSDMILRIETRDQMTTRTRRT